jgi:anti-anti-sigma factor
MKGNLTFHREPNGVVVMGIIGDFTNETTPHYQKMCNEVMQSEAVKGILLDFSQVLSIDTSAFACMLNFIKEHADQQVRIGIVHISEKHKALLEILKLENTISYFGSKEEALLELQNTS